jgi:cell division protein FtsA
MPQKEEIYIGLDLGSSKITAVVAKRESEDHLSVIGVGTSHMTGIKKGAVAEIEETVSGISEAVEVAERMAGVDIGQATVNINGGSISSLNSPGVVAVGRADKEITFDDVCRAEEASQAIQMPANKDVISVFPRVFKVDDQEGIKDPIGMSGIRLEVQTHIVTAGIQPRQNLHQVLSQAGIIVEDMVPSPLAAAKAVAHKRQMDLGCVVIDIGAATTGITVYEEGVVYYTHVLPIGGTYITNDIAIGLRTSIDIAEKVKLKYGHANRKGVSEKLKIDLSEIDIKEEGAVTQRQVAEIIEPRVEEIFSLVREKLVGIEREALLPAGAIITGGTAKMPGIEEKAKEVLKLPAEIGQPHNLFGLTEKVYDPSMSVAVGLLIYNFQENKQGVNFTGKGSKPSSKTLVAVKRIIKNFLP